MVIAPSTQVMPLQLQIPLRLWQEMQRLIQAGWFRNNDDLLLEALRRYLELHQAELLEQFIQEDIQWGLHGVD